MKCKKCKAELGTALKHRVPGGYIHQVCPLVAGGSEPAASKTEKPKHVGISDLLEANIKQPKTMTKEPTHIIYGDGRIKTNKGKVEGRPCLTMRDTGKTLAVGTTSLEGPTTEPQENFDVIISFRNIEGARLLQDMLNELVAEWSREASPKVESL